MTTASTVIGLCKVCFTLTHTRDLDLFPQTSYLRLLRISGCHHHVGMTRTRTQYDSLLINFRDRTFLLLLYIYI